MGKSLRTGVGICTYNRPHYLKQCLKAVKRLPVDTIWVYDDASTEKYEVEGNYHRAKKNGGVAKAKNWLLKKLMDEGCDYIFLCEDDIIPHHPKAITQYIKKSNQSGIEHFMFAHHGPVGKEKFAGTINGIDLFTGCVGAWCFYTRHAIEKVGYFDENFKNAWEHIEHTKRIADYGLTTPWGIFPDVHGSKKWIRDIPGSIDNSSIKVRKDWMANSINGLIYWKQKDPRFPLDHILDGLLKEEAEAYQALGLPNERVMA